MRGLRRSGVRLTLDYPPTARTEPRRRHGGPLDDRIAAPEAAYRRSLETILGYADDLVRIPVRSDDPRSPAWLNGMLPGLDGASIYAFLRDREPATYLEVGSGNSTRFARRAIDDGGLATRIVSIDPSPRVEIDDLCDEVVRAPLELADPGLLDSLAAGDVLFLDGSHRVFTGSDATVFMLDDLPALAPGVLVGIHDIYLPDDYPEDFSDRLYSEQYLLAALLLGDPAWIRPKLAAWYVSTRPGARSLLEPLWSRPELREAEAHGGGFWVEVAPESPT